MTSNSQNNESDLHALSDHEETILPKRRTRATKIYTYHSHYNDIETAHDTILAGFEDGYKWRIYRKEANINGSTQWYH